MSTKKEVFPLIGQMVILSGDPRAGFHGEKVPLPTKDGRTLCCLAQRGECRYNSRHYEPGLGSDRAWSLPQIEPGCNRMCPDRKEVADPKTDQGCAERNYQHDPYGFRYYKRPSDACQYRKPEGGDYAHDAKTCPQCSQPRVEPSDDWVDVVMVNLYAGGDRMMFETRDDIEELPFTPGTKAAIHAKLAKQGNGDEE